MTSRRSGLDETREIARGLALAVQEALEQARAADAAHRAVVWSAAANVAELLDLSGLCALLAACEPHLDAPPRMVTHALERLARLAHETGSRGDLSAFAHADRQLAALAGAVGTQEWSAPGPADEAPESVQPLADLLGDFELDDSPAIARAQVTLPVAAGLRAALDWLAADAGGRIRVTLQESALMLAVRAAHEPGLAPAGAVLALSGGALLPEPDGRWSVRVPLHTGRPAFLLVRQGGLSLALPWHAVARLRIADDIARAVMTEPSLRPWSPLVRSEGERPAALLALGLTRAWLHLDHVVWRVFASPEPAEVSDTVPGGRLVVRTEEGEEFVVVDVSEALRGVPALHTPRPQPRPRPALSLAPSEGAPAAPQEAPVAAPDEPTGPIDSEDVEEPVELEGMGALRLLGPEDVQPIGARIVPIVDEHSPAQGLAPWAAPAATAASVPAPALVASHVPVAPPATIAPTAPATPEPSATTPRLALVVDDSLVARLSLGRVLEREGWRVEWVEHATEMWETLHASPWGVVFVDVSLPDASGRDHLRALVANRDAMRRPFTIVALTRDAREDRMAQESGVERRLRKPFATGTLEELVRALPAPGTRA